MASSRVASPLSIKPDYGSFVLLRLLKQATAHTIRHHVFPSFSFWFSRCRPSFAPLCILDFSLIMTRIFKALRRSIKGEKEKAPHISIAPKSAVAIVPPKKVIRALYDYTAQTPQELSFSRGDFFHVIGRENDQDWYEACNPALPDARGLVPVAFFQALGRTERDSGSQPDISASAPRSVPMKSPDNDSGYGDTSTTSSASQRASKTGSRAGAMVYGVVMYDFQAERADELEAKAGEAIIVIAQSNPEWFVAKPIGRLGGPGLIPVSFVEIRDMASNTPVANPQDAVRRAGIPRVEEWKKMAADYKNSSITLGKFEAGGSPQKQSLEQGMERMSLQQANTRPAPSNGPVQQPAQQPRYTAPQNTVQQNAYASKSSSQLFAPINARIPRYCFAEDKYWFVIEAELEDGRVWELSRYYEDFYDFQIALLTEFPVEAGTTGDKQRTLPYMPGPVNYVTDAITEGRRHNLDAYVKNLLAQPPYIARCNLVKQFFAPREGDIEIDPNTFGGDEYRLSGGSQRSSTDSPADGASRQSSRQNLNGTGYSGLSAPNRQMGNPVQPQMTRQTSSLSQPSQTSLSPGIQQAGAQMKVKLSYNGDIIAIKVPSDIAFRSLYERVLERLRIPMNEPLQLSYRDEPSGDKLALMSDNDLDLALERNEKLLIYVE
ncbi:putative scd2 ral3 protein [Echria macrotheca]|uniref:Scd2 ral3 protein n=1 Tax=Echria macrotheca TaxID=438768 RepID=A0AAJ0BEZ4_9PEZI|nr:putative scd2 ral3 protein [Echria macrotheca]